MALRQAQGERVVITLVLSFLLLRGKGFLR